MGWRGVVVQSAGVHPPMVFNVEPGDSVTFGRGAPGQPVDLALPGSEVSRRAGRITAVEDHWVISNYSPHSTYVIENPEGGGEFVKVAPRRLEMPVPFEFSRVVVPGADRASSFFVFAPQHLYADRAENCDASGDATRVAFPLDETAKYFLVLVALCEPRLRDGATAVIPTVPAILHRLAGHPGSEGLTRAAVNFHIEYLASKKLRVKVPGDCAAPKADWQRSALISVALQFDLVRAEHLALLPPQT